MTQRGIFITFEGPEGSGKSTQVAELSRRLEGRGLGVLQTREPGGTPVGEAIREILQHDEAGESICEEAELLLFAASRAQLVRRVMGPALTRGDCVICDRFVDSTIAYQGYGRGVDIGKMALINQVAIDGAIPDLTLLLDIDIQTAMRRLENRNRITGASPDRIERENQEFHRRVRAGYLDLANQNPERFMVLDGRLPSDRISDLIWNHVQHLLNR